MKSQNKLDPIEYYDNFSLKYDDILNSNHINTKNRDEVKQYFLINVKGKYVLDFGGGTGKDVEWLTNNGFIVYFCEPSKGMREVAVKNFQKPSSSSNIIFLYDDNSNFQKWSKNNIPLEHKVDGILSNFAVFNSIKQLGDLSEKLGLISHPGTHLIISVLNVKLSKILSCDLPVIVRLYLSGSGLATKVKDGNHQMVVHLHTKSKMIKSLKKYFDYVESFPISGSSFRLFHFVRNDNDVS